MNETYKVQVQDLVDDLKAVFTHAGLGGEAGEYKLLTQSFLYKFLNDKFLYQAKVLEKLSSISLHASSLMRPFFHKASTFSLLSLSI